MFIKLCASQTDFCGCYVLCRKPKQLFCSLPRGHSSPSALPPHSSNGASPHQRRFTAIIRHHWNFAALYFPLIRMARQQLAGSVYWSLVNNCLGNKKPQTYHATAMQPLHCNMKWTFSPVSRDFPIFAAGREFR